MYLEKLFNDYSNNVDTLFTDHQLKSVEKLYEIKNNTYRVSTVNDGEESYIIRYDFNTVLSHVFNFSETVIKALKKEIKLLGQLFVNDNDPPENFVDKNTLFIVKTIENDHKLFSKKANELQIMFWHSSTVLSITKDGVSFYDNNGYVLSDIIPVVDDDGEPAILKAIESFNRNLAKCVNIETKSFDKAFFEKISQLSCVECFNLRKKIDEFKFVEPTAIEAILKPIREKDRFSSHWMNDSMVVITSNYSSSFLAAIKLILRDDIYAHFLKAFNFYHNYTTIMNEKYISFIKFDFRHKLDEFDTAVITIHIGSLFEINISVPFKSADLSRAAIFHVSGSVIPDDTPESLHTDTLSELYDYIFNNCNKQVLSMIDKPLEQFEKRDIELVRMIKI